MFLLLILMHALSMENNPTLKIVDGIKSPVPEESNYSDDLNFYLTHNNAQQQCLLCTTRPSKSCFSAHLTIQSHYHILVAHMKKNQPIKEYPGIKVYHIVSSNGASFYISRCTLGKCTFIGFDCHKHHTKTHKNVWTWPLSESSFNTTLSTPTSIPSQNMSKTTINYILN